MADNPFSNPMSQPAGRFVGPRAEDDLTGLTPGSRSYVPPPVRTPSPEDDLTGLTPGSRGYVPTPKRPFGPPKPQTQMVQHMGPSPGEDYTGMTPGSLGYRPPKPFPSIAAPPPPKVYQGPAPVPQAGKSSSAQKVARMSTESEQRLLDTLEQVAALVNDGSAPNEAIAKSASALSVPAGHIHLLVEAYNTGRTTRQRKEGADVWEKAAAFPLADAPSVLALMYPDKTAEVDEISSDYAVSPAGVVDRLARAEKRAWARSEKLPPLPAVEQVPLPHDDLHEQWLIRQQRGAMESAEKCAQEARRRTRVAFDLSNQLAEDLAATLKSAEAPPYTQVRSNSLRLHGDQAAPLFDFIEETHPVIRQASVKQARAPMTAARGPAYDLVRHCLEARTAYEALRVDMEVKQAAAVQARIAYFASLGHKDPEPVVDQHPLLGTPRRPTKEAGLASGLATGLVGAGQSVLKSRLDGAPTLKKPGPDPNLDAEAQMLKQRSVIQSLLAENQGQDPHRIIDTYRGIADVAPVSASKPAVARDFVNRAMAGGSLSYFDLEALSRLEKNLTQIQNQRFSAEA